MSLGFRDLSHSSCGKTIKADRNEGWKEFGRARRRQLFHMKSERDGSVREEEASGQLNVPVTCPRLLFPHTAFVLLIIMIDDTKKQGHGSSHLNASESFFLGTLTRFFNEALLLLF